MHSRFHKSQFAHVSLPCDVSLSQVEYLEIATALSGSPESAIFSAAMLLIRVSSVRPPLCRVANKREWGKWSYYELATLRTLMTSPNSNLRYNQ